MHVTSLKLVNFRSYCDATASFGPGLNVVVGENATGKTNLLEGAWFALRAASPRTRREDKLIQWGASFARIEVVLEESGSPPAMIEVGVSPRAGRVMKWSGLPVDSIDDLRRRSQAAIFVPESLLLVKGSPARRRGHIDAFAAGLDRRYALALREFNEVWRQRNAQLDAVRAGASERALGPWDAQYARSAVMLGCHRREIVSELGERFSCEIAALTPRHERYALQLVSQLEAFDFDEVAVLEELRRRRDSEVRRGFTSLGPHRDDVRFIELPEPERGSDQVPARKTSGVCASPETPAEGRDLRLFGSQGEQRLAVLALLLAEEDSAARRSGRSGILFLDDVMSELDDVRRRLLVDRLTAVGQAIVTTTNRYYFTDSELENATVIELPLGGSVAQPERASSASGEQGDTR